MAGGSKNPTAPAEVFAPGEFIQEELDARGWTQKEFAEILDRPAQTVNLIIKGKKEITPETAVEIGAAFGTSAEVWLNLQQKYALAQVETPKSSIERRARLRELGPIMELQKRGWICQTADLDELEKDVRGFLEIDSVDETPRLPMAARRKGGHGAFTPAQICWGFRARHIAATHDVQAFDLQELKNLAPALPAFSRESADMGAVEHALAEVGVRFVSVSALPGMKLDGAMFMMDPASPVIALSYRYKRVDGVWFTLMHELAHILLGHSSGSLDTNLVGPGAEASESKPRRERDADRLAGDLLIPPGDFRAFVQSVRWPYCSANQIRTFADTLRVHPGIVVGRLQHEGRIQYSHHRGLLETVDEPDGA